MTARMLEVRNVGMRFGGLFAIADASLSVAPGSLTGLIGPNGAGKTTLTAIISGFLPPTSGRVLFEGADITAEPPHQRARRGIARTFQIVQPFAGLPEGRRIFPDRSIRENLMLGSFRRARARRSANMVRVLDTFPRLHERLGQAAGTLSGGEQQMLAIGRGMMAEPRLLILDEPSLGLSPLLVEQMFDLVRRLHADGLPVLLVEQNVVQLLEIAGHAYILENGACALSGPAAALGDDPALKRAYLGL